MLPRSTHHALDACTPKINPLLAKGLAVADMQHCEAYVDAVFRNMAKSLPPELKYLGGRRCTPLEEYAETCRSKQTYDVAKSNVFLMEYSFQFMDEPPIKRYMYLPFVEAGGTIYLSGGRFVISPVLADQVISISLKSVFVRLLKARLTVETTPHTFRINGVEQSMKIAWSKIYNKPSNKNAPKATTSAKSSLVHYLLAKHGLLNMYQIYTGCTPVVGTDEITTDRFPQSDWVICETDGLAPRNYKAYYASTRIKIAIPKAQWCEQVANLTAGLYYVIDHFPDKVDVRDVNNPNLWMLLLGHVIWSGHVGAIKLTNDVRDHFQSLDEYLGNQDAKKLKVAGYESRDVYHLMYHIITNFDTWSLDAEDRVSTMYNKELSVLQFVCYDIITAINQLYFNIVSARKKDYANSTSLAPMARGFNRAKVEKLIAINLRQGLVYHLPKEDHGEVSTTGTSGDNMALKVTALLVPQFKSTRVGGRSRTSLDDPTKRLHVSIAEVGGAWALPKSDPDGRSRLNLTVACDPDTRLILRDPSIEPLLDSIQQIIRR